MVFELSEFEKNGEIVCEEFSLRILMRTVKMGWKSARMIEMS